MEALEGNFEGFLLLSIQHPPCIFFGQTLEIRLPPASVETVVFSPQTLYTFQFPVWISDLKSPTTTTAITTTGTTALFDPAHLVIPNVAL